MNIFSRLISKSRITGFPGSFEKSVTLLSAEESAKALIEAVGYCLALRNHDEGTMISMALLDPGNLSVKDCEALFANLAETYNQVNTQRVTVSEFSAISARHGKAIADEYKRTAESNVRSYAIGIGILMTRLSYRVGRLTAKVNQLHEPVSPYTRIASSLRAALPHINRAAEQHNEIASATTPEKMWSKEGVDFAKNSANIIAMTFPG